MTRTRYPRMSPRALAKALFVPALPFVAFLVFAPSVLLGQITASNEVYIDTSKIVAATVDARINACLGLGNNVRCDASKDSGTVSTTINLPNNGATLILGNLTAPSVTVSLISITGNGNRVSCGQGWNTVRVVHPARTGHGS
jgi:hypothetical protein